MTDLLFDVPWWIPTVMVVVGLGVTVSGNRRRNEKSRGAGLGLIGVAIVWSVMSYLIDTPKEKCQKQTRQFVQSVVDRNWATFDGLLDTAVTFNMVGTTWRIDGREDLDKILKADIQHVGLKTAHVTEMNAAEQAGTITLTMTVLSTQEVTMDQPLDSEWEFDWKQTGGRWLLRDIRCLRVTNMTPDQARNSLPAH